MIAPQPKPTRADRHKGRIDTSMLAIPRPERHEDAKYRQWVRETGTCFLHGYERHCGTIEGRAPIEAAHLQHGAGKGTKGPDYTCVPLCPFHHDAYDAETIPWQIVAALWMRALHLREQWHRLGGKA